MTNRGAIHHPGPLRKTRCVRIGTITSHCPAFRGPFSATAKMLVCCPECWAAPLPFPLWRNGGKLFVQHKRVGKASWTLPERSGEDKAVWWEVHKRGEKPYLHAEAGEQESSLTALPPAPYTEKEEWGLMNTYSCDDPQTGCWFRRLIPKTLHCNGKDLASL